MQSQSEVLLVEDVAKSVVVSVQVNDDLVRELTKEYVRQYCEAHLETEWLTRADIKAITQMKSDQWIREHIDNAPYVRAHGLVFYVTSEGSGKQVPRYHKEIREYLSQFGDGGESK